MTRISRKFLSADTEERIKDLLYGLFADVHDKRVMRALLDEFFTPVEHIMFAKRLAIGILLAKGWRVELIGEMLRVSSGTITAMNNLYARKRGYFRKYIEKIIKDEENEEAWANVEYLIGRMLVTSKGSNWSANRRAVEDARRKHHHAV